MANAEVEIQMDIEFDGEEVKEIEVIMIESDGEEKEEKGDRLIK